MIVGIMRFIGLCPQSGIRFLQWRDKYAYENGLALVWPGE